MPSTFRGTMVLQHNEDTGDAHKHLNLIFKETMEFRSLALRERRHLIALIIEYLYYRGIVPVILHASQPRGVVACEDCAILLQCTMKANGRVGEVELNRVYLCVFYQYVSTNRRVVDSGSTRTRISCESVRDETRERGKG